jgi:hypothetical protein
MLQGTFAYFLGTWPHYFNFRWKDIAPAGGIFSPVALRQHQETDAVSPHPTF